MAFIEGAKVEIYRANVLIAWGYTDKKGRFSVTLTPGTYKVVISKPGYATIEQIITIEEETEFKVNLPAFVAVPAFKAEARVYKPHVKVSTLLSIPTYLYKVYVPPIFTRKLTIPSYLKKVVKPEVSKSTIISIPTYLEKAIKPEVKEIETITIPTYLKEVAKPDVSSSPSLSISTSLTVTKA